MIRTRWPSSPAASTPSPAPWRASSEKGGGQFWSDTTPLRRCSAVQKELVGLLKAAGHASRLFYVPINVTNTNIEPAEPTQRSRSFLFAGLAFVIAQMFGKDQFTFYENGVVSLNLPIAKDVLGSRATKTTHPKVIRGFERIFSLLAQSVDRDQTLRLCG